MLTAARAKRLEHSGGIFHFLDSDSGFHRRLHSPEALGRNTAVLLSSHPLPPALFTNSVFSANSALEAGAPSMNNGSKENGQKYNHTCIYWTDG